MKTTFDRPLAVIGGGAMAEAIVLGAQRSGALAGRVSVADPSDDRRAVFEHAVATAAEAMDWLDDQGGDGAVMLAVKPQMLDAVSREIGGRVGERLVVSILAGSTSERVLEAMGGACRLVRVMPNTPALIGRGTSAVCASTSAAAADGDAVEALFRGVGDVVVRIDESQMDGFTGVAGSGPAYVFYLAEAMERAAAEVGVPVEHARAIVAETIA
ncbi:MAG: pyrroline-5-carboxylate reductase dimerization domain-containing protein, partial [Planctomycetota bacterium]